MQRGKNCCTSIGVFAPKDGYSTHMPINPVPWVCTTWFRGRMARGAAFDLIILRWGEVLFLLLVVICSGVVALMADLPSIWREWGLKIHFNPKHAPMSLPFESISSCLQQYHSPVTGWHSVTPIMRCLSLWCHSNVYSFWLPFGNMPN